MKTQSRLISSLYKHLYTPMDVAGLAVVRMFFGAIIVYESYRYTNLMGFIPSLEQQQFYFKYRFFEWVQPLSAAGMRWVFIVYGIAGFFIAIGLFYRLAAVIATLCISYIFLVEATNYLNHFYLVIVFSGMMIFIPANKGWSVYAWLNKKKASSVVPGWAVWLIRGQLAIVYFHAAIAKMNVDWINGMPLQYWLSHRATEAGFESYLGTPATTYFFTYTGLLYDVAVAPLLLFRRTRAIGYCLSLSFHLTNFYLFNIGIFPWFMLATTTIFFDPGWPRFVLRQFFKNRFLPLSWDSTAPTRLAAWQKVGFAAIAVHLTLQALIPLRHFAIPNYASWSEDGHNFSWHMKLRGKNGTSGFVIRDPASGRTEVVHPGQFLTKRQAEEMSTAPDLILQFAHYLRDKYTRPGEKPVEVYAETKVNLNKRGGQRLIDPSINLSNIEPSPWATDWIFPLRQPVWNTHHKKNRFGPAVKVDDIAMRAIHKYGKKDKTLVDKRAKADL